MSEGGVTKGQEKKAEAHFVLLGQLLRAGREKKEKKGRVTG